MRFTSANEHGNASNDTDYHDRQHTSADILGVDTDGDQEIDSFFVDFNYLARNAEINAVGAVMSAIGPEAPVISSYFFDAHTFYVEVESTIPYPEYRIGLRTDFNDFDTLYSIKGGTSGFFDTENAEFFIFLSAMAVDTNGIESLPSEEVKALFSGTQDVAGSEIQSVRLLQNRPNPFDESTIIAYLVESPLHYQHAEIAILDLKGNVIQRIKTEPQMGMNEVLYHHGYHASGTYVYALMIDGNVVDERKMVFAN
jgi:hypothetical protein